MAVQPPTNLLIPIGHLSAEHIGLFARFKIVDTDRNIGYRIEAEIRQVSHDGSETTVTYGEMAERQFTGNHEDEIIVNPSNSELDHHLTDIEGTLQ